MSKVAYEDPYDGDPPDKLLDEQTEFMDRILEKMARIQRYAAAHGLSTAVTITTHDHLTGFSFARTVTHGSYYACRGAVEECMRRKD